MTTVAYRSGILAADTQMTLGDGLRVRVKKLRRLADGSLFAGAGDAPAINSVERWAEAGFPPKPRPRIQRGQTFDCIVVRPDGSIWLVDNDLEPEKIEEPFAAFGTGGPYALGAMACGRSAVQAVKIAARFDTNTSEPIDSMTLVQT